MNFTVGSVYTRNRPRKRHKQLKYYMKSRHESISCNILNVLQTIYKEDYNLSIGFIISKYYSNRTLQEKYHYIHRVIYNNSFIDENLKNTITRYVYKFQFIIKCVNIIKQRFKLRKMKVFPCEESFDCTPLKEIHSSKKIRIIELKTVYEFKISDLLKVCLEHLTYSEYLISTPKKPKNPFTNIVFSDHNIYNLYVKLKRTHSVIPFIFESYVKNNMNLNLLVEYNDIHLNWLATLRYVNNMEQLSLLNYIHTIFNIYTNSYLKLQSSQTHKDYIIQYFKSSIYCDCFILNFEPDPNILFQKTNIIIRNLGSFITKHPSWIEKKTVTHISNIDTDNENEDSDDVEESDELTEITSF